MTATLPRIRLNAQEAMYLHRYLRFRAGLSAAPPAAWWRPTAVRIDQIRAYGDALIEALDERVITALSQH